MSGPKGNGRDLLAPIVGWITGGLDTPTSSTRICCSKRARSRSRSTAERTHTALRDWAYYRRSLGERPGRARRWASGPGCVDLAWRGTSGCSKTPTSTSRFWVTSPIRISRSSASRWVIASGCCGRSRAYPKAPPTLPGRRYRTRPSGGGSPSCSSTSSARPGCRRASIRRRCARSSAPIRTRSRARSPVSRGMSPSTWATACSLFRLAAGARG